MTHDKQTAAACRTAVENKLRVITDQRNHFEKVRGNKIYPNPFRNPSHYANTGDAWLDIFYECAIHIKDIRDEISKIEGEAADTPPNVADMEILNTFIAKEFPGEIEASEGRSSALIAISLIERLARSLEKKSKKE